MELHAPLPPATSVPIARLLIDKSLVSEQTARALQAAIKDEPPKGSP
ncbi:hypothetical protein [Methylibium sp.]|nr:hypothetical protein [Methylibium sp.]MBA3588216.1 hypothetical protein [Methylibium sp.]